ncbi:MAG: restriction endonuclease subunit S [Denitromonas halophila]|nr:MAG: restriction endonuclease subunit S [Denitromonas halophila]
MSGVSFLEKLLDGSGVEWKALGDLSKRISSGGTPQTGVTEYWEGGTIPWMSSGEVNCETIHQTENFITEAGFKNSSAKFVPKNSLVVALAGQGKTRGKVARTRIDLTTNQSLASITLNEEVANPDYLYHFLKTQYENLRQVSSGSGARGGLNLQMISSYKCPIPCPENSTKSLRIQAEIVRILDAFTELISELISELAARKQQYDYYRDQLLSFENGEAEWKPLEDVFDIFAGGDAPKGALSDSETEKFNTPILSNGIGDKSLYGWTDKAKIDKPSLTISARGTIGWTSYRDKPFFPIVRLLVLTPKIKLNLKYAYYFMKTIENDYKIPEAGIPQLTKPMLKGIKIPLPCPGSTEKSLAEQARIASVLDKFDVLTTSFTEGLPGEIELRQKQYAYYREKLLNFPKPEAVEV